MEHQPRHSFMGRARSKCRVKSLITQPCTRSVLKEGLILFCAGERKQTKGKKKNPKLFRMAALSILSGDGNQDLRPAYILSTSTATREIRSLGNAMLAAWHVHLSITTRRSYEIHALTRLLLVRSCPKLVALT